MAKKFVIRSFQPGTPQHNKVNPLINLSNLGINGNRDILKSSMSYSASETAETKGDSYFPSFYEALGQEQFNKYRDLTKSSAGSYAYFDLAYATRRLKCQELASDQEINFILETIANAAIINDENGYVAQLDIDRLKLFLNKDYLDPATQTTADSLIRDCKIAYNIVYSSLGWDANNGAWHAFKQFLTDGFLAYEILLDNNRANVIGMLQLDPQTLEPVVEEGPNGEALLIWYQFRGQSNEKRIPDSNIIYIAWNGQNMSKINTISYVEGLLKPYNMLKQIEQSHVMWNIQNAQKRMKITVPVGEVSEQKANARISQIMAEYTEEVSMDDVSGQLLVNGEPKFNFQKTYVFADHAGNAINIEEIETAGYDMSATDSLQYFWRKFILETQVPANRFTLNVASPANNQMGSEANVTREEYAFSRFIQRLQSIFKEILLKALWVQLCIMHPKLSTTNYLRQGLGIVFNEENLFALEKKRQIVTGGAQVVSSLASIMGPDQKPYFSLEFLVKEYLGLSDADLELNKKYKEGAVIAQLELAKLRKKHAADAAGSQLNSQASGPSSMGEGGGFDIGGGFDMGPESGPMPDDGGFESGPAPEPEAPAPETGEDNGGF